MRAKKQSKVWFYMVMQTNSANFNEYNTKNHAKTYTF